MLHRATARLGFSTLSPAVALQLRHKSSKALVFNAPGEPEEVLQLVDQSLPDLKDGHIEVEMLKVSARR